jgi:putative CocE/NonD family hydrolase
VVYPDRASEDRKLLTYTSEPLATDVEITGVPLVSLRVASTHEDGSFHVYLEDVAPDGRVTYVTEGIFRAINRRVSTEAPPYRQFGPYHSYRREDAMPLVPGEVAELAFELFATSVRIRAGHRLRLALAGTDRAMFDSVPAGVEPTWRVQRGGEGPSYTELTMKAR